MTTIEFRKFRTTEAAVLQFALVSDTASFRRLEKIAKDLRERLNQVGGVRATRVWGIPVPGDARRGRPRTAGAARPAGHARSPKR